jgi:hypothetical protein
MMGSDGRNRLRDAEERHEREDAAALIIRADREMRRELEAIADPKLRAELLRAFE